MRFRVLVIVACGCLWLLPGQAAATHVNCGDTLTAETVLDSDVVCSAADSAGLIIGGDDFTLWLGHHEIVGPGTDVVGSDGVRDDGTARSGVTIRGGTITGFEDGVDLDADDSAVKGLHIQAGSTGIAIRGARNYLFHNTTDFAGFTGIEAIGDDTELWGNEVLGTPDDGIVIDGENPRVLVNSVQGCLFDGVVVTGYTAGIVARNTVTGCDYRLLAVGPRPEAPDERGNGQLHRHLRRRSCGARALQRCERQLLRGNHRRTGGGVPEEEPGQQQR